jgi:hypothetical protein
MQSRSCEPKLGLALRTALSICLILLLPVSTASADEGVRKHAFPWSDSFITRLEALALLQTLNADLPMCTHRRPQNLGRRTHVAAMSPEWSLS